MNKKQHTCQFCGGTIGHIERVEHILPSDTGNIKKYIETWFDCIYCKSEYDPSKTLVEITID